jgi:hypothetical protein
LQFEHADLMTVRGRVLPAVRGDMVIASPVDPCQPAQTGIRT